MAPNLVIEALQIRLKGQITWQPHRPALPMVASILCLLAQQFLISVQAQDVRLPDVVDVLNLDANTPHNAIVKVARGRPTQIVDCDLLIAGGGMGGVAAALAALRNGKSNFKVCLTEEGDWLGGQMTAQAVSALDENYLVESSGACRSYQELRSAIRSYYKDNAKLSSAGMAQEYLNPGSCWVTRLAFEPLIAVRMLEGMLEPFEDAGRLTTFLRFKSVDAKIDTAAHSSKHVRSVTFVNLDNGETIEVRSKLVIDATELGDLLPLCRLSYDSGSDSKSMTKEAHAPEKNDRENVQDFTFPFVVEFCPGESHKIAKPAMYDEFNRRGKFSFQGYKMFETVKSEARELLPFWDYRRLIDRKNFNDPNYPLDVAMINWDSNDLRQENIIDQPSPTQADRLAMGKLVSLGFLYWLQNEASRDDGGKGYPELKWRTDVVGTTDGLSKYPYIRESRRIQAERTIIEADIVATANPGARAKLFADSVGIGFYPVDIHGYQEVPGAGQETRPFQIPLASLVPTDARNLLPGCKNIGTTHITNGAYRLHPIEWAIGEAQGTLAVQSLRGKKDPLKVLNRKKELALLQKHLIEHGSPLYWFDDVPTSHVNFSAIQFLCTAGIMQIESNTLKFNPDAKVTRAEVVTIADKLREGLSRSPSLPGLSVVDPQSPASLEFIKNLKVEGHQPFHSCSSSTSLVSRAGFAEMIFPLAVSKLCNK